MKHMLLTAGLAAWLLSSCGDDKGTDSDGGGGGNQAPVAPHSPQPANGSTGTSTAPTLGWQCSDADGDALTYDVYFGTSNPPALHQADLSAPSFSSAPLNQASTYYWRVSADDGQGHSTSGPIWSFTTGAGTSVLTLLGSYDTPGYAYDVAVQGNYLYVADGGSGLLIFDISNLAAPVLHGTYATSNELRRVFVSGDFAYLSGQTMSIVNVANPTSPTLAAETFGCNDVVVIGRYAYQASGGFRIVDVLDQYNPTLRGFTSTYYPGHRVSVSGTYAYVATGSITEVYRFYVANPDRPETAGEYTLGGDVPYATGNRLYLALWFGVQIIGSNLTAISTWTGPEDIHDLTYEGGYLYVASPDSGVMVVDVSQESQPATAARLNPTGSEEAVVVSNRIVCVAAGYAGVHVLRFEP